MLKGALIGFGAVAEKAHAAAWLREDDVRLAAVTDASATRRDAARGALPGIHAYDTLEALLAAEPDLDFVDIATPPHLHAPQARLALSKKLHVLCEKPLALSRKDFASLRAAALKHKRALFTVHNWKYAPIFQKLRSLLDAEAVGAVRHAQWHTLRTQPAAVAPGGDGKANWRQDRKRSGGGILVDHGWHAVYLLSWLLGDVPRAASGALGFPRGGASDAETDATVLLQYPRASAVMRLTWNSPRRGHWGMICGDAGTIEIQDDRLAVALGEQPPQSYVFPERLSAGSAHPEWFHAMLPEFRAAIAHPKQRAQNLAEAQACVGVIEDVYSRAAA